MSLRFRCLALTLLAGGVPGALGAQAAPLPDGIRPARGIGDRAALESFVDGMMAAYLPDKHIAGVTVSVVKDGALFFAKGYGYADVAARKPVDPATTMFRIGSVSKLFTWTAVMQLVEQGKLDLETDINQYLDFAIPATFAEPITLRHVLTHTPGLEEDSRDLFTTDSSHITPMGTWLPAHMPKRVRPPGTYSSYSNWATAVAGYIVERVSGLSYDDYVEQHILTPLGMAHTTTRQPLPARFAADMSHGYQWKDGWYESKPFEIITGGAPAGSIAASATDMARFMLAHLGGGALGDARILSPATTAQMHTRLFGHDDRMPGFAHGFYEQSANGLRLIGHGGDTQWFHSDLALIPSENVGVFISTNTDQGSTISFAPFLAAFLDHFYPEDRPTLVTSEGDRTGATRYAGEYLFNRMNFSTWQKAMSLAQPIVIRADTSGALLLAGPFGNTRLVAVDSMLFRDVASGQTYAFEADPSGNITHGFISVAPMMVLERRSTLGAPRLHRNLLILGLIMFGGIVIAAVVRFFGRRSSGGPPVAEPIRTGRRLMVGVALLLFSFIAVMATLAGKIEVLLGDTPGRLKIALTLPVLAAVLVLAAAWVAVRQWRTGAGSLAMRVRHSGAVLVALVFMAVLHAWNLLGWRY